MSLVINVPLAPTLEQVSFKHEVAGANPVGNIFNIKQESSVGRQSHWTLNPITRVQILPLPYGESRLTIRCRVVITKKRV